MSAIDWLNDRVQKIAAAIGARPRLYFGVAVSLTILYVVLAVAWSVSKEPQGDEAWLASPPLNLITKGYMGMSVLESGGVMDRHYYTTMPLYLVAEAAWFKMAGFSLISQRALSIGWSLVMLASCFGMTKILSGNRAVPLLALGLVALDFVFVRTAAFGRMDMMCAALGFAGYATFLYLRERNLQLAILVSQSMIAMAGLSHPNGFMEYLGLLYLTLSCDFRRLRWRHIGIAAIPYTVGAAAWSLYIFKDPQNFLQQMRMNYGHRFRGFAVWNNLRPEIVVRYLNTYGFGPEDRGLRRFLILILILLAIGLAVALLTRGIRQHPGYRKLLVLLAIHFGFLSFFNDYNPAEYLVHIIPLFAVISAVSAYWWWSTRPAWAWAISLTLCSVVFLQISAVAYRVINSDYRRYYLPAVHFLAANSDDQTFIMGDAIVAYDLGFDRKILDDVNLGYYSKKRPDVIVVNHEYELQFQMMKARDTAQYKYVLDTLASYEKLYQNGEYTIYGSRSRPPTLIK
jgi:hypothetical protein